MFAMVVHGGAGQWEPEALEAAQAGLRRAIEEGRRILTAGGSALDAVVAAAVVLEDDPIFNAGTGATLNLHGDAECDASVMCGDGLRAGAVAGVRGVKNPILVARRVMEETDHVLVAGEGAEALATAWGLRNGNEPTPARRERWRAARAKLPGDALESTPKLAALLKAHPELAATRRGTIGAVARDSNGRCAVATSTGGTLLKLPGRIGDTPIPGAGSYASHAGAASATGQGELMLRSLTTKVACDLMAQGHTADAAAKAALARTARETGTDLGLISVDLHGNIGIAHATVAMPHAWLTDTAGAIVRTRVDP